MAMTEAADAGPGYRWWDLVPRDEAERAALDAGMALVDRRRALITAHRDVNLRVWLPQDTGEPGWLATWAGEPAPGEHREDREAALYDWLDASLAPATEPAGGPPC